MQTWRRSRAWFLVCTFAAYSVALTAACSGGESPETATQDSGSPDKTAPDVGNACVPGASVACTGPGACSAYQVCNQAGSGFDPCDCNQDAGTDSTLPSDSGVDAADTGTADVGQDADREADAGGAETDGAADADAAADAGAEAEADADAGASADAGSSACPECPPNQKFCSSGSGISLAAGCVPVTSPDVGCASPDLTCSPCNLPHAQAICSNTGACAIGACQPGFADCNGNPSDGCEADLLSPTSCTACNVVCGATQVCSPTGCATSCTPPLTQCGNSCANLATDPERCGSCAVNCDSSQWTSNHGFPICSNGQCGSGCSSTATNCSGQCVDTMTDDRNCGGCGQSCSGPKNGRSFCSSGSCTAVCPPSWTQCGTTCVTLRSDPANCGACSNTCSSGESCVLGSCTALSSLWLTTGLSSPEDILVDATTVYWTDTGDGTVRSMPKTGGNVTVLAQGQQKPWRLATDGQYIYWTNLLGGGVMRTVASGTAAPALVAAGNQPWGLVVDSTNVYWSNSGDYTIRSAPVAGGSSAVLTSLIGSPSEMITDGSSLYIAYMAATNQAYAKLEKNGAGLTWSSTGDGYPVLGWGNNRLYAEIGSVNDDLVWLNTSNGSPIQQVDITNIEARALAVDACWLSFPSGAGQEIYTMAIGAPVPVATVATNAERVFSDGKALYWTDLSAKAIGRLPLE